MNCYHIGAVRTFALLLRARYCSVVRRVVSQCEPMIEPSLLLPFWSATTMYGESVTFLDRGERTSDAALLFRPRAVLKVTSSAGDVVYEDGGDYTIDRTAGRILRLPDSRMPMLPANRHASDGALLHEWQSVITYAHDDAWTGYRAAYAGAALPRATGRVQHGERLTIGVMGDSISEGYDASGYHRFAPLQPPYPTLVAAGLEQRCGCTTQLHNIAVAGSTAADGVWATPRIAAAAVDLVVVAYGMNDASYAEARHFRADVAGIVSRVRTEAPHAEFILVAPMRPTANCDFVDRTRFPQYRDALADLCGDGIALADMTALWTDVLRRKAEIDLSGNGLNHPNDFGHRLYAQTILAMLAPGAQVT
jgi:acyl-CoA thioesterase-1